MKIKVVSKSQLVAYFDKPGRIEVKSKPNGELVAYAYDGAKDNEDQDPSVVVAGGTVSEIT